MKTLTAVGVSILVGFLCLRANARIDRGWQVPGPDGKTIPCKIAPPGLKSECVKYECNDAALTLRIIGCDVPSCKEGEILDEGPEDTNKMYPDCCPQNSTCRTL